MNKKLEMTSVYVYNFMSSADFHNKLSYISKMYNNTEVHSSDCTP